MGLFCYEGVLLAQGQFHVDQTCLFYKAAFQLVGSQPVPRQRVILNLFLYLLVAKIKQKLGNLPRLLRQVRESRVA